jgi:serine/threonine-protein kinase
MSQSASSPLSRAQERIGTVLKGKWRLDAVIGVGGMSAVFAATHRNGSRVAIKVLNPEYAAQPEFVARFMREGYVANKINHPSSVLVLDDDIDEGCAFLVMELLTGYSLEKFARRGGRRLRLGQILHAADKVLDLLSVAHGHGILHRDIKPANIHVTSDGLVKVLDFGIARLAERVGEGSATQTGAALGTPSYMPPEQARGRWNMVDPRTDLWALGATIHALILGERPRRAETVQEEMLLAMTTPLASLAECVPGTPQSVVDFVACATAFDMNARFPDARTMQMALRQAAQTAGVVATTHVDVSIPPPAHQVGSEPGSVSGPRVDTGGMVPPIERSPSTQGAMGATSPPPPAKRSSRAPLFLGIGAGVAVVALGVGLRVGLRAHPADVAAAPPAAAPGVVAVAATSEPAAPAPPSTGPASPPAAAASGEPAASAAPPAMVMGDIDEVPTAATPAPSASAKVAESVAKAVPAEPHHPKPTTPADPSSAILDQQF